MRTHSTTSPTGVDTLKIRPIGTILIISAIVAFMVVNALALVMMYRGLEHPIATATAPGTVTIDARPGSYHWTRPTAQAPSDEGTLTFQVEDATLATVTPLGTGSYVELRSERHDILADMEITGPGPVTLDVSGNPAHFPVTLLRDQKSWVEHVGRTFVLMTIIPAAMLITGVTIAIRNRQRRTRAMLEFIEGVQ